uniref:Uncharacterized protein n=1 Tax=Dromaius novaehollandiae TaxID=8790 RepID=A0A8C4JEE1_DRONO
RSDLNYLTRVFVGGLCVQSQTSRTTCLPFTRLLVLHPNPKSQSCFLCVGIWAQNTWVQGHRGHGKEGVLPFPISCERGKSLSFSVHYTISGFGPQCTCIHSAGKQDSPSLQNQLIYIFTLFYQEKNQHLKDGDCINSSLT